MHSSKSKIKKFRKKNIRDIFYLPPPLDSASPSSLPHPPILPPITPALYSLEPHAINGYLLRRRRKNETFDLKKIKSGVSSKIF